MTLLTFLKGSGFSTNFERIFFSALLSFSVNLVGQLPKTTFEFLSILFFLQLHITTCQVQQRRERGQGAPGELPPSCWLAIILQKARLLHFLERWDANPITYSWFPWLYIFLSYFLFLFVCYLILLSQGATCIDTMKFCRIVADRGKCDADNIKVTINTVTKIKKRQECTNFAHKKTTTKCWFSRSIFCKCET